MNNTTSYTYDSQGRVLTITRPDGGVTTYTYEASGPLTITESVTSTQNRTTTLAYYHQGDSQPPGKLKTIQDSGSPASWAR